MALVSQLLYLRWLCLHGPGCSLALSSGSFSMLQCLLCLVTHGLVSPALFPSILEWTTDKRLLCHGPRGPYRVWVAQWARALHIRNHYACLLFTFDLGLECCVKWADKSRADWGQELSNLKWIREKRFLLSKLPSLERKGRLGI